MCTRFLVLLALVVPLVAGDTVVLRNGFVLRADRHEQAGPHVRLFTEHGEIELPAADIASIESDPEIPAAEPAPPPPPPPAPRPPEELIEEAAKRYGLPPEFLHSVARVESAYRADAVSPKGAIGIMQLMPGTAAELGADPGDPEQNVDAGARHLRDLLLKYEGGVFRALAAYNAGSGAVDKYAGVPPYRETVSYIERIVRLYEKLRGERGARSDD